MTKGTLLAVIGGGVVVVVALAVLTPTVIVGDDDRDVRAVAVGPSPEAVPLPAPQGRPEIPAVPPGRPYRGLRRCLQKQGLGPNRSAPPSLDALRKALRACGDPLPGPLFRP